MKQKLPNCRNAKKFSKFVAILLFKYVNLFLLIYGIRDHKSNLKHTKGLHC